MDIWQINKILLFLVLFIPGFISVKVYELFVAGDRRDFTKSLFEVVTYSALNFAALSPIIVLIHEPGFPQTNGVWYVLGLLFIFFIAPALWPLLIMRIRSWKKFAQHIRHPIEKPWDYVFSNGGPYWMIIHLKDGRKIAGQYAGNSFASSYPVEEQLYLEEVWELNDNEAFVQKKQDSQGILVYTKEVIAIEFFGREGI